RHRAVHAELHTVPPMGEVRKRDDHLAADAEHLLDDDLDAVDLLQRLRQDHRVERPVAKAREARFEVALDHVDAALDAREDVRVGDVDAVAARAPALQQVGEQLAVTAAQVEHALALADPARDDRMLAAVHGALALRSAGIGLATPSSIAAARGVGAPARTAAGAAAR